MSRYNPFIDEVKRYVAGVIVFGAPALAVGLIVDDYVGELLIWGGTKCVSESPTGIKSCFGYPPTGIIVIMGITTIVFTKIIRYTTQEGSS